MLHLYESWSTESTVFLEDIKRNSIEYAYDEDAVNTIHAEDKMYKKWEREQKNRLLAMTNWKRKQELWREMFGVVREPDDSYLKGKIF